jgi:lipoprotein NlpI
MTLLFTLLLLAAQDAPEALIRRARQALQEGDAKQAAALADQAIQANAAFAPGRLVRGLALEAQRQFTEAAAELTKALELDPKLAEAYHHRGCVRFRLNQMAASLADFDRFLELNPAAGPGHWQRGITCYYAGKYAEGQKQFERYQAVDANDVENAVWKFLCQAKAEGVEKARAALLPIGRDRRVPMMEVYDLFRGRLQPADVLAAVEAGMPARDDLHRRRFYAHLYLGLYAEILGQPREAQDHLTRAAEQYPIDHYMADVARVHLARLRAPAGKP